MTVLIPENGGGGGGGVFPEDVERGLPLPVLVN